MAPDSFFKIIPKPKPKAPRWVSVLFYSSILLLVVLLAGFSFLKKEISSFEDQKQLISEEITGLSGGEEEQKMEEEVFEVEEKINVFLSIFKNRNTLSNFFSLFESTTHPRVRFSSLEMNSINRIVSLIGKTDSFQFLGEQVLILEKYKDIEDISLSNISFDREGNIDFNISFSFSSEVFSGQEQDEDMATTTSATTTISSAITTATTTIPTATTTATTTVE